MIMRLQRLKRDRSAIIDSSGEHAQYRIATIIHF